MAGGIGSRLWPMSRTSDPKQFHDVLGAGRTLIQQTLDRFRDICPIENVLVVTNAQYLDQVKKQLPEIPENNILLEPDRRNTAPCIAYACFRIEAENPNARIVVASSDHLILKADAFRETILMALEQAAAKDCLITLGIKPSRPDTGYGYIQFTDEEGTVSAQVKKVKTFTEKPNLEIAKQFIESGDFYWNSGIFIWSLPSILKALERYMPHTNGLFAEGRGVYSTLGEKEFIERTYQQCKNISIDYGVMEKAKNVYVLLSDFGWSDLGTWGSLYTHIRQDDNRNAIVGKQVKTYDTSGCLVNVPKGKLVVLQGLEDFIVVDTGDVLLVCKREEEQRIKEFVSDIKNGKGEKFI